MTLTLDEETARWARLEAARREVSVSRLVREMLRSRNGFSFWDALVVSAAQVAALR